MTEKRFKIIDKEFISYYGGNGHLISNGNCKFWLWHDESESQKVCDKLNIIMEENEQLKKELKVYRKIATCGNCNYHNYDWFDDGDEFEVCDKGNDNSNGICEDWEELD